VTTCNSAALSPGTLSPGKDQMPMQFLWNIYDSHTIKLKKKFIGQTIISQGHLYIRILLPNKRILRGGGDQNMLHTHKHKTAYEIHQTLFEKGERTEGSEGGGEL
jgi:hypothetical protein